MQRLVSLRPDLIRTWTAGSGCLDTDYEWHPTAKIWQTPDAGEQMMASFTPELIVQAWEGQGIPAETARPIAARIDERMKSSILALYRSAVNVSTDWLPLAAPTPPGLVLWGADDPFAGPDFGKRLADRTGAKFTAFPACGHWWPLQRPTETAALLEQHWV